MSYTQFLASRLSIYRAAKIGSSFWKRLLLPRCCLAPPDVRFPVENAMADVSQKRLTVKCRYPDSSFVLKGTPIRLRNGMSEFLRL